MFMGLLEQEKKTLVRDSLRQAVDGLLESLRNTVFLLVAINVFSAPDWQSSLISQSHFIGLLLSFVITPALEKKSRKAGLILFSLSAPGGLLLIFSSFSQSGWVFSLAVTLSVSFCALRIPFFTGIYAENYQPHRRARLMSIGTILMLLVSIISNYIFGELLDRDLQWFRIINLFSGILLLLNGWTLLRLPGEVHPRKSKEPFWHSLKLLYRHRIFGWIILAWSILGFANLWTLPLRTVYLGDPQRGLGLPPSQVLLILGIIPGIIRMVFSLIWAQIYDRMSFITMRLLINFFLITGILLFFQTPDIHWITLGSALISVALAGSPFIWNLWVTRIAPPEEIRRYMSVHTFMAGIRGILAPMAAFAFIRHYSILQVGKISLILGIFASLMFLPLISRKRRF